MAAVRKIREAEEAAKALVVRAREDTAPRILQEAHEAAGKSREDALVRARSKADDLRRTILDEARQEAEEIRRKADDEISRLREEGGKRIPGAVERIKTRLRELL